MNYAKIIEALGCEVLAKSKDFTEKNINNFVASDLMSDILMNDEDIDLMITSLSTYQSLRTANIINASGVLIVNDKPIMSDLRLMAVDLGLTLIKTKLPTFEVCAKLAEIKKNNG